MTDRKYTYVVGDIAGHYGALCRLIDKCEDAKDFIFVGDLVDRGPDSNLVVKLAMESENAEVPVKALMGNHEHMMIDYCLQIAGRDSDPWDYGRALAGGGHAWVWNGGTATLSSYGGKVPTEVVEWLNSRPTVVELEYSDEDLASLGMPDAWKKFRISHAMKPNPEAPWRESPENLWNRMEPIEIPGVVQICGHNSHWGLKDFKLGNAHDERLIGLCIDDSRHHMLTAVRLPDLEIVQESY